MFKAKRLRVTEVEGGGVHVQLDLNGLKLVVANPRVKALAVTAGDGCGIEHFGIKTDDIKKTVGELKAAGVKFVQEVVEGHSGTKHGFFLGPDNMLIELLERKG